MIAFLCLSATHSPGCPTLGLSRSRFRDVQCETTLALCFQHDFCCKMMLQKVALNSYFFGCRIYCVQDFRNKAWRGRHLQTTNLVSSMGKLLPSLSIDTDNFLQNQVPQRYHSGTTMSPVSPPVRQLTTRMALIWSSMRQRKFWRNCYFPPRIGRNFRNFSPFGYIWVTW